MSVNDDLTHFDERLTVLRAQRGDRASFSRLIDVYDKRLLYFVRRILGETDGALDILQAVWLIVHKRLRKLKSLDAFPVWLYRIAHDQAVTELRKRSRRPVLVEAFETIPEVDSASVDEATFENAEMVHIAMLGLSVDHRRVLTLRFLENMTIDEIAEVISCSAGTVKSRLHYARNALRRRIEEQLND